MSEGANGQPVSFQLDLSASVSQSISQLLQQAKIQGHLDTVIRALKTILQRLKADPLGFGELIHHHHHLNLLVHVGLVHPLMAYFAVHPEKHFVILQKLVLVA